MVRAQKLSRNDKILVILQVLFALLPCGIMIIPDIYYYPDMGNIIFLLLVANVILNIILLLKRDTIFQKVAKRRSIFIRSRADNNCGYVFTSSP